MSSNSDNGYGALAAVVYGAIILFGLAWFCWSVLKIGIYIGFYLRYGSHLTEEQKELRNWLYFYLQEAAIVLFIVGISIWASCYYAEPSSF